VHSILHDRYRLGEFQTLSREFITHSAVDQCQLGALLSRSEITFTSSREFHHPLVRAVPLHIHIDNSTSANVGRTLLDLDVELRRSASLLITGSNRPIRNSHAVELISAQHQTSIDLVVAVSNEPFNMATSRPIDFSILLHWCWSRRLNRTKNRKPFEEPDPVISWQRITQTASICIDRGQPVALSMSVAADGSTTFAFTSL